MLEGANNRRQQLQDALMLTSEFAELERPLTLWLDSANKRLQELGKIATDPEKLQEQILTLQVRDYFKEAIENLRWRNLSFFSVFPQIYHSNKI